MTSIRQKSGKINVCHSDVNVLIIPMLGEIIKRTRTSVRPKLGRKKAATIIHKCIVQNERQNRKRVISLSRNTSISVMIKIRIYVPKEESATKELME